MRGPVVGWLITTTLAFVLQPAAGAETSAATPPAAPHAAPRSPAAMALPPFVVTATRLPPTARPTAATVDTLAEDHLQLAPALALDDVLRGSAAFSLFRRTSSTLAHPTAQGVSLRGIGPSGASRSLVLFDGIPLNDPFGGWVAWSKVPRLTLQQVEIVRGGGSGVWGNAALGGTIQLFSRQPQPGADAAAGALAFEGGTRDTLATEFALDLPAGDASAWQLGGRWFQTNGPFQYARNQRGPIDRRLESQHAVAHASFTTVTRTGWRFSAGGRFFDEERGNGTPLQRNASREHAVHARLSGELGPELTLDVLAYGQDQTFASFFSSVDEARASERPALDQFDVPATAWGGAIVATLGAYPGAITALGADVRAVSGETREDFLASGAGFERRRIAGGDQIAGGVFASHERTLAAGLTAQIAARLDRWRNTDGHRREWELASGTVVLDTRYADTSGTEFSPSLGVVWEAVPGIVWRASLYRAFRVPTLNELHRPFRVGDVATNANPALRRETVTGGEMSLGITRGAWSARAGLFQSDLRDGVANVTLSVTPQLTQRQRLNLDRIRIRGLEAGLGWRPHDQLDVHADLLITDARVRRAAVAPGLVGRRLPQVPRTVLTLRGVWRPAATWRIEVAARATSRQFEDDENLLPLAGALTVDLSVRHRLRNGHELVLAAENLLDAEVETGRTAAGLVSLASGVWVRMGWTVHW